MRRLLLIAVLILVGSTSLLAFYLALDLDPDETSPLVSSPSYEALFQASVRQRAGKPFEQLDGARRMKVLSDILASREMAAVREVALYRVRTLSDKSAAFSLLRRHLISLPEDLFEVGVASIAALELPSGRAYLDSLYAAVDRDPAAHTPLGGYRASTLLAREKPSGMSIAFNERTRIGVNYSLSDATDITLLFPAGPEYVVAVPNADDVLDRFNESRFMHALDGSPVPEDAWALPLLRTVHGLRKRLKESLGFLGTFFSPEQLLRDELIVGRYGEHYLLASHKDKNVVVAEALVSVFEALGGNIGIRRWRVNETTASAIVNRATGRSLSYATVGGYLVVATDTALMTRSLKTYHSDRGRSIAIDPVFNAAYRAVDHTGREDVFFAWFNPSKYFDVTGSDQPAAYRRAVLAHATGRSLVPAVAGSLGDRMSTLPSVISSVCVTGDNFAELWRYVVTVRSLGRNPVDSLARLAGVDISRQIAPFIGSTLSIGYQGVEHLKREYGFSNTSFDIVVAVPLANAKPEFGDVLRRFFAGVTSLVYTPDSIAGSGARAWIASDTTTNDSALLERKLQPSFAVLDNGVLLIATTPGGLRTSVAHFASMPVVAPIPGPYLRGVMRLDSFATNASRYLRSYLLRSDRYSPAEIAGRIDPLRNAIAQYGSLSWSFVEDKGLRSGEANLGMR